MKKYVLAVLLLAGSRLGSAQTVHLGLKVGASFSRFAGADAPDNTESRFGFNAGALAEIGLGTHWAVQPEVLYVSKGTRAFLAGGGSTFYQQLGYLDVPVLLKYKAHHVFVEAGPQLGILLGATSSLETSIGTTEVGNKDAFRPLDAGYVVGLGVQDTNGLLLGVRYNGGLATVDAASRQVRNSSFQLYVGYLFGFHQP